MVAAVMVVILLVLLFQAQQFLLVGYENYNWVVRRSADGTSGSFTTVYSYTSAAGDDRDIPEGICVSPVDGAVYVTGRQGGATYDLRIVKSSTGLAASFTSIFTADGGSIDLFTGIAPLNKSREVYAVGGQYNPATGYVWSAYRGADATFASVEQYTGR
jgi:hypothetical protein